MIIINYRVWKFSMIGMTLLVVLSIFPSMGCIGRTFIGTGRRPDTTQLEQALKPQISTETDVLKTLGPPKGKGQVMLPVHDDNPRTLWHYYYEETYVNSAVDHRIFFLFVFIDNGRYDGYLWFSSLPVEKGQK